MKHPKIVGIVGTVSAIVGAAVCFLIAICPLGTPEPFHHTSFQETADLVLSGVLKPDKDGVVVLPPSRVDQSATGRIYMNAPGENFSVFFPSWVGRRCLSDPDNYWIEGYLYHKSDSYTEADASWYSTIPLYVAPWQAKNDSQTQKDALISINRIDGHWDSVTNFPD